MAGFNFSFKSLIPKSWRSTQQLNTKSPDGWFNGLPQNHSGEVVNTTTAMRLSTVYRCIAIISDSIASLPKSVFDESGPFPTPDKSNPINILLHYPNAFQTGFVFWQTVIVNMLTRGNAYVRIYRNKFGIPERLKLLKFEKMQVFITNDEELLYIYDGEQINFADILHYKLLSINGFIGLSPIQVAAESIGVALAQQKIGAKSLANGTHQQGVVEMDGHLSDPAFKQFQDHWRNSFQGSENAYKMVPILEYGAKWKNITLPLDQIQFLESREFSIEEICRWFGVPPHLVMDLRRATFSNIEHQDIQVVKYTLRPFVKSIEEENDAKLFPTSMRLKRTTKINLDGFMRGDSTARSNYYRTGISMGYFTRNEVRAYENLAPLPGLDEPLTPLNMVQDSQLSNSNA